MNTSHATATTLFTPLGSGLATFSPSCKFWPPPTQIPVQNQFWKNWVWFIERQAFCFRWRNLRVLRLEQIFLIREFPKFRPIFLTAFSAILLHFTRWRNPCQARELHQPEWIWAGTTLITIPTHTIPYQHIPYHAIPYHTIPCHTILYHAILYGMARPCNTMP